MEVDCGEGVRLRDRGRGGSQLAECWTGPPRGHCAPLPRAAYPLDRRDSTEINNYHSVTVMASSASPTTNGSFISITVLTYSMCGRRGWSSGPACGRCLRRGDGDGPGVGAYSVSDRHSTCFT